MWHQARDLFGNAINQRFGIGLVSTGAFIRIYVESTRPLRESVGDVKWLLTKLGYRDNKCCGTDFGVGINIIQRELVSVGYTRADVCLNLGHQNLKPEIGCGWTAKLGMDTERNSWAIGTADFGGSVKVTGCILTQTAILRKSAVLPRSETV